MSFSGLSEDHLRHLLDAGRLLAADTGTEEMLRHVLNAARTVTDAHYAALFLLGESQHDLERFITSGLDEETWAKLAGDPPARTFLGVPIETRGAAYGNLYITEKAGGKPFSAADEVAIGVLADWAALTLERARTTARDRLLDSVAGSERERRRWSRELHDETLQGMGAIRVGLATGLRKGPGAELERAVADAIALLGEEIGRLRGLITDLRPAALDEFGLAPALEELARRAELRDDNRVTMTIALANELGIEETRLDPELESTVYRIVQESLRNAGRHAQASVVAVSVIEQDNTLTVTVEDDGAGFDPRASRSGFGLRGLRERADLRGGAITIASEPGAGTTLTATLPVERVTPEATP